MEQITIHSQRITLRPAQLDEIFPLRHRILQAGLPAELAYFPNDRDATTHQFGAFESENEDETKKNIACLTLMQSEWESNPCWRLRGMAVTEPWQGKGLGRALLTYALKTVLPQSPIRQIWCNARTPAIPFYERQDWKVVSEEFEIPNAGPHVKMIRSL